MHLTSMLLLYNPISGLLLHFHDYKIGKHRESAMPQRLLFITLLLRCSFYTYSQWRFKYSLEIQQLVFTQSFLMQVMKSDILAGQLYQNAK